MGTEAAAIELARAGGYTIAADGSIDGLVQGSVSTMLELMTSDPMKAPGMLALLASSHVALHRVPTSAAPEELVPPGSTMDELARDIRSDAVLASPDHDFARELAWLDEHTGDFETRAEDVVLCHGDFQPANLAVDTAMGDGGEVSAVVGWHSALVGDRHHDVAITRGLFWVTPFLAPGRKERMALKVVRDFLASAYRDAYANELPLDETQLLAFEAVDALMGSVRIAAFHAATGRGEPAPGRLSDPALLPVELVGALRDRFWEQAAVVTGEKKGKRRRR